MLESKRKVMLVQTAPAVRVAIGEEVGLDPGRWVGGRGRMLLVCLRCSPCRDDHYLNDLNHPTPHTHCKDDQYLSDPRPPPHTLQGRSVLVSWWLG